ncbi:DNA polymerase Y family protein [Idiomarina sp. HP20-50]|uniref:Y-family DNA polymerase n=1 Tax=Idiomarina sp. HP20-50 TaxID=3070813 RepID=UPI00294B4277|nr:DNA polymerase Y family protein [Idiomarina sp. HP20-50]MDV6317334.1 DNA polymerase Y family protein [Idiomarina sp. HP20-50]
MWLYCHFPQLLLDNRSRLQPDINTLPLAFYQLQSNHSVIVQCNVLAQEAGVKPLLQTVMAISLCEQLQLVEYCPEREQQVLHQLATRLYQWAAKLVLYPPQGIAIELSSLSQLYGGLNAVSDVLHREVRALPVTAQLACADNPLAAKLLAEYDSPVSLSTDESAQLLAQLPINAAGLSAKVEKDCQATGFRQLGELMQLSAAEVGGQFGLETQLHLERLQGRSQKSYDFFIPPETFQQSLDLVTEIPHWQGLLFPLKRLFGEMEDFFYQRQKVVQQISIELHHRDAPPSIIPVALADKGWRGHSFLSLLQLKMESYPLPAPVLEIRLVAGELLCAEQRNEHFFGGQQHRHETLQLIGRLQAKLGDRAVFSPAMNDDPRPGTNEFPRPPGEKPPSLSASPKRPLWLLTSPEPTSIDLWQLREGPERKTCGWWDARNITRDYWTAKDVRQRVGWLYFEDGQWYLQGWFS